METGEVIFQEICKTGDQRDAIAGQPDANLRELLGWLARLGEINGTPGQIWSYAAAEAVRRFQQGGAK